MTGAADDVTVIIPVHNAGAALTRAVESAVKGGFRVIIVDDGSTDDSTEVAQTLASDGVLSIRQQRSGPSSARNLGARLAVTSYLIFLDADDVLLPVAHDVFRKRSGDPHASLIDALADLDPTGELRCRGVAGAFAVHRDAFHAVGGYDTRVLYGENTDLVHRLRYYCGEVGGSITVDGRVTVRISSPSEGRGRMYARARALTAEYYLSKDRHEESRHYPSLYPSDVLHRLAFVSWRTEHRYDLALPHLISLQQSWVKRHVLKIT